jgi:hypothetical protein
VIAAKVAGHPGRVVHLRRDTCAAYLKELRHADARWEKTEKSGQAVSPV